ncbi:MAG: hypothetical protein FWH12_07945 [Treponema sp.]|nr:hypothetical protein [Treponema sp.]
MENLSKKLKNLKFFGFITLIGVIALSLAACSSPTGGDNNDNSNGGPNNLGVTWTGIAGGSGTVANPETPGDSGFGTNSISGIAYGSGMLIAVGQNGRMAYSANGTSWTGIAGGDGIGNPSNPGDSTFGTNYIYGIVYGGDKFVAVGQGGRMAYSTNGINWTGIAGAISVGDLGDSTFGTNIIRGIAYGGGRFVAVSDGGRMAYSENGTSWTGIPSEEARFSAANIQGIAYGSNKFVAVGAGGRMAYSTDGTSWTVIERGTGTGPNPPTPGDSQFGTNQINGIAYGNGRFVAVGASGRMAYSSDGINWTGIAGGTGTGASPTVPGASGFGENSIYGVAYGGGRFVAGGQNGRMAYSTDGINWTGIAGGEGTGASPTVPGASGFGENGIYGIAYGGTRFVAVGNNGRMAYSPGN